ncbi:GDP-L-fucose synthase [Caenispirillum bisanense]
MWVAGHGGMVGSALVRRLIAAGCEVLTADRAAVDLTRQEAVEAFLATARPQAVVVAAGRVGGIHANAALPADFLHDNLLIAATVIPAAHRAGVEKLLYLGSSCIYPREAPQPIAPDALLAGPLEPTNQWYAVAKIAGVKLCEAYRLQHGCDFISAMPTNLYGPGDCYDPARSHVPAALIARFHAARLAGAAAATVWGSGRARRDFLHVDDLADACVLLLERHSGPAPVNIGSGRDLTIADFAEAVRTVVGFTGRLEFDTSRPDGTPRKLLDTTVLRDLGWAPRLDLHEGLKQSYQWFLDNIAPLPQ